MIVRSMTEGGLVVASDAAERRTATTEFRWCKYRASMGACQSKIIQVMDVGVKCFIILTVDMRQLCTHKGNVQGL